MKLRTIMLIATGALIAGCITVASQIPLTTPVLVSFQEAHGSGTYLGDGRILTAAHVAQENVAIVVTDNAGVKYAAELVWRDPAVDVAVVKITAPKEWQGARINCELPPVGTDLTSIGYLYNFGRVQTWGRVASAVADLTGPGDPLWPEVLVLASPAGPGMSGGPVFDARDNIRAIVVGVANNGVSAITLAVPSTAICRLLKEHP